MRKLPPVLVGLALTLLVASPALAECWIAEIPGSAKRCSVIRIVLASDEGITSSSVRASGGLRFLRGWFHHKGWDVDDQPGHIFSVTSPTAISWHEAWNGFPTFEFEVTGASGTKIQVWAEYKGGNVGDPIRETARSEIEILPAEPRVDLEYDKAGSGPNEELRMGGTESVTIEATVHECGEPLEGAEVTFTTNLGILTKVDSSYEGYTAELLLSDTFDYLAKEKDSTENGVMARTDVKGKAWAVLFAHTPVVRETSGARKGDTRLWSDRYGSGHGAPRAAEVTASVKFGEALTIENSIAVEQVPGTDLGLLLLNYGAYGRLFPGLTRKISYLLADEEDVIEGLVALAREIDSPLAISTGTQETTLQYLNDVRSDPEEAAQMDGYHYAPIMSDTGAFRAVILYEAGTSWESGTVLDPMWQGAAQKYYLDGREPAWPPLHLEGVAAEVDDDPKFVDQYPLTGKYPNHYPRTVRETAAASTLTVVTASPVAPLLETPGGLRSGVLADGTAVEEIPGTRLFRLDTTSGGSKYVLEVEDVAGTLTVRGTGDGTFGLTLFRSGGGGSARAATFRDVPVAGGEAIAAEITEERVFVPLVRAGGEQVWPAGSEALEDLTAKLKVKAPGKDSLSLKGRWMIGGLGLDTEGNDLEIAVGDTVFTVPAGAARVSGSGKVSYKAVLPGGGKVKIAWSPKKGSLKVAAKKLDLSAFGPGAVTVSCECGERGASREMTLVSRKTTLVTPK